jgi:bacillithiol system protein YtxJ
MQGGIVNLSGNFINLDSDERLEELYKRSGTTPVLLFKHSSTCSISLDIYREISGLDAEINLVVVQSARHISNLIASRTGLRHQSPQAIILRNGLPVYHASHYDITAEDVQQSLENIP